MSSSVIDKTEKNAKMSFFYSFGVIMPKPLLILDHHYLDASKDFLVTHFRALRALGYEKILFEMDKEISFSDFKRQMNALAKLPGPSGSVDQLVQSMSKLMDAIEANDFVCEFIDPESLEVAQIFDRDLRQVKTQAEFERVRSARERATYARDVDMAKRILAESERLSGAVISFVGFKHIELLRRLRLAGLDYVALMVDDSSAHRLEVLPGVMGLEHGEWLMMSDSSYRRAHYGQDITYLDWGIAKSTPFYLLKAELGLSKLSDCPHRPLVAEVFGPEIELKMDESYHLQAYMAQARQAEVQMRFPGLGFFKTEDKLCIPGINLGVQQEKIQKPGIK